MAISTGGGADTPMSDINTTPLVDVMLVLLIIFLIAVPVAIQTIEKLEIPVFESTESKDKVENLLLTVSTTDENGVSAGEPGFDVSLAIRPEHITLVDMPPSVALGEARVTDVVFQGSFKRLLAVSAKNPEVTFIVKVPSNRPVSVGDTVELFCPAADMILMSR